MTYWKHYYQAKSVQDALQVLGDAPSPSRLIAGGTDLLLDLQQGRHPPIHTLVDIMDITEMNALEERESQLFIGAALPLNRLVASPLVRRHAQALLEAASKIGGQQVRYVGTLGGNVAHALPAADGTIALLALDAQVEVADKDGRRKVAIEKLFQGPGRSTLDAQKQVIVGFYLPLVVDGQDSAFHRIMRPQGVAIAILNMAVWVRRQGDKILDIRISLGPAGPVPKRARTTEQALRGRIFTRDVLDLSSEALLAETNFRTSRHRATQTYRCQMAVFLLEKVFTTAWVRAGKDR